MGELEKIEDELKSVGSPDMPVDSYTLRLLHVAKELREELNAVSSELDSTVDDLYAVSSDRDLCAETNVELEEKLRKCRADTLRQAADHWDNLVSDGMDMHTGENLRRMAKEAENTPVTPDS